MTELNPTQKAARDAARKKGMFGEQNHDHPGEDIIGQPVTERVGASVVKPGDQVTVWAYPAESPFPAGPAALQTGVVASNVRDLNIGHGPSQTITFTDGRTVHAMHYAVTIRTVNDPTADPDVATALGDGPALNDAEKAILRILLNPANHPTGQDVDLGDTLDELDAYDPSDMEQDNTVGGRLQAHYDRTIERNGAFSYTCDPDGEWYTVSSSIPGEPGLYVTTGGDTANLIDSDVKSGLRNAVRAAGMMQDEWNSLQTLLGRMNRN